LIVMQGQREKKNNQVELLSDKIQL